jgi:two-component system cell cycle sensor histidine kinase/response regulator CckA
MAERSPWWRRGTPPDAAFRRLFEAAPEATALVSAEGLLLAANAALRRMAGPALPLRDGIPAAALLAEADRAKLAAALAAPQAILPFEARPADPSAPEDACWQLVLGPVEASDALLLRVTDVTLARRAEARLAGGSRLETVGRLAGGIAHDFNNLLTAILGGVEAARGVGLPDAALVELDQVQAAARRGAELVKNLLAFARQQTLLPRVVALNEVVAGTIQLLGRSLSGRVVLEFALEQPGRLVKVDPAQLGQVVMNLALNARDAMPEGGRLRIGTGHRLVLRPEGEGRASLPPGRYAVLEVADSGQGMPPEVMARIFDPFFSTKGSGGTGLGLATVQGIVAQSGGHITVESTPGQGTCFRIYLPRHEGEAPAEAPVVVAPAAAAPVLAAAARPLLLVEDEAPLRRLAERALTRAGHAVLVAEDAEQALELMEGAEQPAALVSDVSMPGMDGLALARQLRQRWPGLPVLLLSGYAASTIGSDLESEGILFVAKPYAPADLLAAVGRAMAAASVP